MITIGKRQYSRVCAPWEFSIVTLRIADRIYALIGKFNQNFGWFGDVKLRV